MSITDYSTLSTAVANWMMRSTNTDFTSNVSDFIQFAEARINFGSDDPDFPSPPLRVSQMEFPATTMTVLASTNSVILPTDFLQVRRLYMNATPIIKLTYVTPNQMDAALTDQSANSANYYTIMSNQIVLPAPLTTTQTLVMGYYRKLAPLSTSNTVNWLIQTHPAMYLAGANLEGALFIGDNDEAVKWARIFTAHVRSFRKQDNKSKYSGDAMQIQNDTGNP